MTTAPSNSTISPLYSTDYRVYINHTDAGGIVYHANHLVFFENCRRDWFSKLGLNGYFMHADDGQIQHFVVSQAQLQYKKAIFLDEVIKVHIDRVELKPASIVFYQSIHRHASQNSNENHYPSAKTLLSSAKIVIACVQNQTKPEPANNADTSDIAANAAPIRPIRVPKNLHDNIQQAIAHHSNDA
ncbi:thioesterase family protein [Psychrobacter sp. Cmf 22.2]|uniref:thioesterase family protein n=1 Tax=Psychrobacter sp. Cmf 22.2 TaxID=1926478 RepID=UPI0009469A0C|nr:thioesterase family protein [Psychrobacter sp. Cmf 22.2]OLF38393.1 thioesterase [Psychrobacter sp. Cmf 22.2]